MSLYAVALFAHIAGAALMFMAIAVELVCLHRMRGATTTDQLREWADLTRTTGVLFPAGSVAIVVSGLYMALTTWNLTIPWIGLSLAVMAVMGIFGGRVNTRKMEAVAAAVRVEPSGPVPGGLARRVADPFLLASVHVLAALAFGVVLLKAARPDLVGSLLVLTVAVAAGLLSTRVPSRLGAGSRHMPETGGLTR
ncbi:MAG TPA: hypothetical protein VF960_08310 [Chloroflexota bacterium]